jgi:uncharacterized protein (AIM24 family)
MRVVLGFLVWYDEGQGEVMYLKEMSKHINLKNLPTTVVRKRAFLNAQYIIQ